MRPSKIVGNDSRKLTTSTFSGRLWNGTVCIDEESLSQRGYKNTTIIGTDEVGRGSIAGPAVAVSCCILRDEHHNKITSQEQNKDGKLILIDNVTDSKLLSQHQPETNQHQS